MKCFFHTKGPFQKWLWSATNRLSTLLLSVLFSQAHLIVSVLVCVCCHRRGQAGLPRRAGEELHLRVAGAGGSISNRCSLYPLPLLLRNRPRRGHQLWTSGASAGVQERSVERERETGGAFVRTHSHILCRKRHTSPRPILTH